VEGVPSNLATALPLAPASHVAPIDKLSLPLTLILADLFLGRP